MVKMRTISETNKYLRELDPETAITQNALRRMVVSGNIPCVRVGKKYLIDLDVLFEYLKGTRPEEVLSGYKNPMKRVAKR